LAADFRRHYGIQLFQTVGTEALPWGEFAALVEHMPQDSALARSAGGERTRWGETEHLLAVVIDLLQAQVWQYAMTHSAKGKKPKRPSPYPRPGVVTPGKRTWRGKRMSIAEASAWMERRRRGER
jgi:hypothetical protein